MKTGHKKEWIRLAVGFLGSLAGLAALVAFNDNVLMQLPLAARTVAMFAGYWLVALVPLILVFIEKERFKDYILDKKDVNFQVITGIALGIGMSAVFTVVPHLAGFGDYVDNGHRYSSLWQFVFEFAYCIFAVAFAEEFVFRGFIFKRILEISTRESVAVIGSSVLFGLFHLFGGNVLQLVMTAVLGLLFCLFRSKIRSCSLLSLILAHGIYDALITVWSSVL